MNILLISVVFLITPSKYGVNGACSSCNLTTFPKDFQFGAGSSAYQIEGGWDADGKSPSWWDWFFNTYTSNNANVADDSYHRYLEDVAAIEEIGLDFYRFSISWPRLLPTGLSNEINQAGVDYYNNLIDALLVANIQPLITIYHWDIPYEINSTLASWTDPNIVDYFVAYADIAFQLFGDRVKLWATINEPWSFCASIPTLLIDIFPDIQLGTYEYVCGHHVLLAHAYTYRLYNEKYKLTQNGEVGIVLNLDAGFPLTNSTEDIEATERYNIFFLGWFAEPIVFGDYPQLMKDVIANNSLAQNLSESRLPEFTEDEKLLLKESFDIFFINHYSAERITPAEYNPSPSYYNDRQVTLLKDSTWNQTSSGFNVYYPSIRNVLSYITTNYKNPAIWITENGYSDTGGLNDTVRIEFIQGMLTEVRKATCEDGANVIGYTYWSILDSFEWSNYYNVKYGLVEIDYENNLTRTLRQSAYYYQELIKSNQLY